MDTEHKHSAPLPMDVPTTSPEADAAAPERRRRGRPRKEPGSESNTRSSILDAAATLFYERGYTNTSMSDIAREVGMDPSSLYYYFPSKEKLLTSLYIDDALPPTLEELDGLTSSRAEQLYALIVYDIVSKCEIPFDFIEMEAVAKSAPQQFASFFVYYQEFYLTLVALIEKGVEEGIFRECAADERAVTILSINEGLQHHYHAKQRGELLLEQSGYTAHNHTPQDIGNLSALSVIPSLAAEAIDFKRIAEGGRKVYHQISINE